MGRHSSLVHPGFIYIKRKWQGPGPATSSPEEASPPAPHPLEERDKKLLSLLSLGLSNREIAASLSLPPGTVRGRLYRLFKKLGWKNRTQAALWADKNLPQQLD